MSLDLKKLVRISVNNRDLFSAKILTENEFAALEQKGAFSGRVYSPFNSLFKAFKHASLRDYLKDLSLPLVFNIAMKLDATAIEKIRSQHSSVVSGKRGHI